MSLKPYYSQRCPSCRKFSSCGVESLGCEVTCQHCGHCHLARDIDQESAALEDPVHFWINFTQHDFNETETDEDSYPRRPK